MGIENDIKQTRFRNAHQKAAINLIYTVGWMRDRTKIIFEAEDITAQQFNILRILRGSFPQPLSTLQIRERMLENERYQPHRGPADRQRTGKENNL